MITLNTTCYAIEDGRIMEGTLRDFDSLVEMTTRPDGFSPKFYVKSYLSNRGEVWALVKWATWGGPEVIVQKFETEREAHEAAEAVYVQQILDSDSVDIFVDFMSAAQHLEQLQADQ